MCYRAYDSSFSGAKDFPPLQRALTSLFVVIMIISVLIVVALLNEIITGIKILLYESTDDMVR